MKKKTGIMKLKLFGFRCFFATLWQFSARSAEISIFLKNYCTSLGFFFSQVAIGVLLFSSGYSLKAVEKNYGLKHNHFLTFWLIFIFFILKNYPAKLEIKGLTQSKKRVVNLLFLELVKKIWHEKRSIFEKLPVFS